MKQILQQLASYNGWASTRLVACIKELDSSLWYRPVLSSFGSLHHSLLHMWDAEMIWWQRLHSHENYLVPSKTPELTLVSACHGLLHQGALWQQWIHSATEAAILQSLSYRNLKGEQFEQPVFEILIHIFNHGTYHRGQLVTILRGLSVEPIPNTDFINFSRQPDAQKH